MMTVCTGVFCVLLSGVNILSGVYILSALFILSAVHSFVSSLRHTKFVNVCLHVNICVVSVYSIMVYFDLDRPLDYEIGCDNTDRRGDDPRPSLDYEHPQQKIGFCLCSYLIIYCLFISCLICNCCVYGTLHLFISIDDLLRCHTFCIILKHHFVRIVHIPITYIVLIHIIFLLVLIVLNGIILYIMKFVFHNFLFNHLFRCPLGSYLVNSYHLITNYPWCIISDMAYCYCLKHHLLSTSYISITYKIIIPYILPMLVLIRPCGIMLPIRDFIFHNFINCFSCQCCNCLLNLCNSIGNYPWCIVSDMIYIHCLEHPFRQHHCAEYSTITTIIQNYISPHFGIFIFLKRCQWPVYPAIYIVILCVVISLQMLHFSIVCMKLSVTQNAHVLIPDTISFLLLCCFCVFTHCPWCIAFFKFYISCTKHLSVPYLVYRIDITVLYTVKYFSFYILVATVTYHDHYGATNY